MQMVRAIADVIGRLKTYVAASAIVIPVPEAEPVVDLLRREHTRDGAEGMPAHITLIYPFAPAGLLTAAQSNQVRNVLTRFPPFAFELVAVRRFTERDETHLWLEPDPRAPFIYMTAALANVFPQYAPYGGAFDDVVPHLTVASSSDEETLEAVEQELAQRIPIAARVTTAALMVRVEGRWRCRSEIALEASE